MVDHPETAEEQPQEPEFAETKVDNDIRDLPQRELEDEDAALERILGGLAEQEQPPAAEAETAPEPAEEGSEEPQAEAQEGPAPVEDQPDDGAYRLAAAALRRDGWSTEDVALLPRERVIALGDKRRKVQDDVDTAYAELTEFRKGQGAAGKNEARSENEAEASPDLTSAVQKLSERLALDEDGAQELAAHDRALVAPLLAQIQELRQSLPAAQKMAMQAAAETARRDLQERFPEVKDPKSESAQRVWERMGRMDMSGYSSVTQMMEDAILLEHGAAIAKRASERSQTLRTARANGQVMTAAPAKETSRKLTQEEHERAAFDLVTDFSKPREERLAAAHALDTQRRNEP